MQVNYAIKSDWELIDKFWLQQVWMNIKYFTQIDKWNLKSNIQN